MLNNLMCLDFYKDLENYIGERRYSAKDHEVLRTLADLDTLVNQHGLNSIDFDTECIQRLLESIQDCLKASHIEVLQIDLTQVMENSPDVCNELNSLGEVKIKIKRLQEPLGNKSMPGTITTESPSQCETTAKNVSSSTRYANRHLNGQCMHHKPSFTLKLGSSTTAASNSEEIKVKNAIITRLKEQLEHKLKRILELKNVIRGMQDTDHQSFKAKQYKEALEKVE